MKNNISFFEELKELNTKITESNSILILTHASPDGDALGSVVALKLILKKMGKMADCLLEEVVPSRFPHLKNEFIIAKETDKIYDLVILVDCADRGRTNVCYPTPKCLACIDHHISNPMDMDINLVDATSSATAELMYLLLKEWEITCDEQIAGAIYTGILTDTGGFLFSNTTKRTLSVVTELLEYPFDRANINRISFMEKTMTYSTLYAHLFDTLISLPEQKAVIGFIDYDTYTKYNASSDDTDGLSGVLRNISGIECAVLLTEREKGLIKGSVRTNDFYDANLLAKEFGGGGHLRAAGFKTTKTVTEIKEIIYEWLSSRQ